MKKIRLEETIRNVRVLLRNKVPIPVILVALKGDGIVEARRETIIRWAKLSIERDKIVNINTIIDAEFE